MALEAQLSLILLSGSRLTLPFCSEDRTSTAAIHQKQQQPRLCRLQLHLWPPERPWGLSLPRMRF